MKGTIYNVQGENLIKRNDFMKFQETYFEAKECKDIKEILYNSVEKYAGNIAFVIKHKTDKNTEYENITYAQLLDDINSLGTKMFELGYENKRVAIFGRNRYEWVIAHLTNLLGGILSIPLDKELQVNEIENSLIRSEADIIIFDEKYEDKIEDIKQRNKTKVQNYICMGKCKNYEDIHTLKEQGKKLLDDGNKEYVEKQIDETKMNILLFTSGTTSMPKAVMLSQKNIASNIYAMQLVEPIFSTDVNLAFLPFHHIFGSTCLIMMLACGVKTAFPDGLKYVAQNLREYKVSVFVGVPLLVEAIYKNIQKEIQKQNKTRIIKIGKAISNALLNVKIDIRRKLFKQIIDQLGGELRFVISGGAPLNKDVAKGFNELGIEVAQGYGLTETSPVIVAENYKKKKPGTIGVPMNNVEVDIINKDKDQIGELIVKGPNVMLGYYMDEERTNEVLKDGWFYTGDLAFIDKDGYIQITGRKKDMIVLKNGKKVFPEEIESIINQLDIVEECMVYGIPKEDGDVKLSVKVVYNKEEAKQKYPEKTEKELEAILWEQIKQINKTFPPYKYIKNLVLTDQELIKTTTKKIKRNEELKRCL